VQKYPKTASLLCTFLGIALVFLLTSCSDTNHMKNREQNTNIIVIVLDTLRPDHLGCYGYSRNTSPNLDRFAEQNIVFANARVNTTSSPRAHFSLFTGSLKTISITSDSEKSIVRILNDNGYYTLGVSANNLISPSCMRICKRFREFGEADYSIMKDKTAALRALTQEEKEILEMYDAKPTPANRLHITHSAENMNQIIFRKLQDYLDIRGSENEDLPLFLFINYIDVHDPYFPREPYRSHFDSGVESTFNGDIRNRDVKQYEGSDLYEELFPLIMLPWAINYELGQKDLKRIVDLYDAEIAYLDHHVDELLSELKRLNLYENSAIFILADHGELLGEHNLLTHSHGKLFKELISIPLIVHIPGLNPKKQKFKEPILITDIKPTILELLGIPAASENKSTSLLTLLKQGRDTGNRIFISRRIDRFTKGIMDAREAAGELVQDQFRGEKDGYDKKEKEELEERLKALGYMN